MSRRVEGDRADHVAVLHRPTTAFARLDVPQLGRAEAEGYVDEKEQATGWRPARVALFGGALPYTQYGFVKRHMMKKIASGKPGHLGTDVSRVYVNTEWDGVQRFAEDFLLELVSGEATRPRSGEAAGTEPGASGR